MPRVGRVDCGRGERLAISARFDAHTSVVDENLDAVDHHFDPHPRDHTRGERTRWVTAGVAIITVAIADVKQMCARVEPHACRRITRSKQDNVTTRR